MSASLGNVLLIVENLSVPMDRRAWQECETLRDAGYKVYVICPRGKAADRTRFEVLQGVEIHRYPLRPTEGGRLGYLREYSCALFHTYRIARALGRSRKFVVVHACNPPDLLLWTALPLRRRGAALVFDHHDLVPELYLSRFQRGQDRGYMLAKWLERWSFRLADAIISTNESYRRVALERGGQSPDDVFVVRSAPKLSDFKRVPDKDDLRYGKRYLLAYLGVMGPQDGIDHALHALAALSRHRDDWHCTFIGSGDVYSEMVSLSSELGLSDCVNFTGRIPNDELIEILSTADIGLAPDPMNPLNNVSTMNKIVEYMSLGLPVVSYDLREARVSAGPAAVYAQPSDPEDLAATIASLLDDPQLRHEMSTEGQARVSQDLSWQRSEENLLRAYRRAIERRHDRLMAPTSP